MITLREFLKISGNEHYRIYQPNRDCLIFESYFTVHSPYYFDNKHDPLESNKDYWDNNDYCRDVYTKGHIDPAYDEETAIFLEKFGEYEICGIEISSVSPKRMYKGEDGELKFEYNIKDSSHPDQEYLNCYNIFIVPADPEHHYNCERCYHHKIIDSDRVYRGWECIPDEKDIECKKCWRFIHKHELEYTKEKKEAR